MIKICWRTCANTKSLPTWYLSSWKAFTIFPESVCFPETIGGRVHRRVALRVLNGLWDGAFRRHQIIRWVWGGWRLGRGPCSGWAGQSPHHTSCVGSISRECDTPLFTVFSRYLFRGKLQRIPIEGHLVIYLRQVNVSRPELFFGQHSRETLWPGVLFCVKERRALEPDGWNALILQLGTEGRIDWVKPCPERTATPPVPLESVSPRYYGWRTLDS